MQHVKAKNDNYFISSEYLLMRKIIKEMLAKNPNNCPDLILSDNLKHLKDFCPRNNCTDLRELINKKDLNIWKFLHSINTKVHYVNSGSSGHFFKGYGYDGRPLFAMKVIAYPKSKNYQSIYNSTRPENTELLMIRTLSYFVINHMTNHLILPIATFYTDIQNMVFIANPGFQLIDKNEKYSKFIQSYQNGKFEPKVSVFISELANKGDFLEFLRMNLKLLNSLHFKVFIFQILSVLAVIHTRFPNFRHNDFKANNILVHCTESIFQPVDAILKVKRNNNIYTIHGKKYRVPNIGFIIKIWDFDFACIPGVVGNIKVENEKWTHDLNIKPVKNQYYDLHFFLTTLVSFIPDVLKYSDFNFFYHNVIPEKFQNEPKCRLQCDDEYVTPIQLLESSFYFNSFRI